MRRRANDGRVRIGRFMCLAGLCIATQAAPCAAAVELEAWRDRDSALRSAYAGYPADPADPVDSEILTDGRDAPGSESVKAPRLPSPDLYAASVVPSLPPPETVSDSVLGGAASRLPTETDRDPGDARLISVEFERAALKDVLRAFARFTGLNIIASDALQGEVTIHLDQVPWRQAFEVLLDAHGLGMRQHGDVIWVAAAADIARRLREHNDAYARQAETEPLASRLFDLHYQRAEDMHRLLGGSGPQRVLSKRGAASADVRSNRLFVTDVPARLEHVAQMIASFDQPARQVMIEARIVEADEGFSRALGFRLGLSGAAPGMRVTAPDGVLYDLPAGGLNGVAAASAALSLFGVGADRLITLELSALEADGRGKVLSSPRVVTTDRSTAIIEQGTELPYQTKVRSGVSGLQFRRAALRLEVRPHITPDHRVSLDVDVSKDTVGAETAAGPAIDTKHVKTQVEVDNGGTVAIGGIFAYAERRDVVGVPGLHRLPWIGALFRRTTLSERKTELIVFITPTVVDAGSPAPMLNQR